MGRVQTRSGHRRSIDYRAPQEGTFDPDLAAEWNLDADRLRWERVFGAGSTAGPELPSVLWTHTPGGVTGRFVDVPVPFPSDVEALTRHYWSGVVAAPTEAPAPFPCLRYVGPWLSNAGCPLCAPSFPAPFVALPGVRGLSCGAPFVPPVIALPDLPFDLGPLLPDPGVFNQPGQRWPCCSRCRRLRHVAAAPVRTSRRTPARTRRWTPVETRAPAWMRAVTRLGTRVRTPGATQVRMSEFIPDHAALV